MAPMLDLSDVKVAVDCVMNVKEIVTSSGGFPSYVRYSLHWTVGDGELNECINVINSTIMCVLDRNTVKFTSIYIQHLQCL